jgi:hypothetical protein
VFRNVQNRYGARVLRSGRFRCVRPWKVRRLHIGYTRAPHGVASAKIVPIQTKPTTAATAIAAPNPHRGWTIFQAIHEGRAVEAQDEEGDDGSDREEADGHPFVGVPHSVGTARVVAHGGSIRRPGPRCWARSGDSSGIRPAGGANMRYCSWRQQSPSAAGRPQPMTGQAGSRRDLQNFAE